MTGLMKPKSDQFIDLRCDVDHDEGHGFTKRKSELTAFHDMTDALNGHIGQWSCKISKTGVEAVV